jgi:hypothetical protein
MSRIGREIFCSEQVLSISKVEIDRVRDIRERAGKESSDCKKMHNLLIGLRCLPVIQIAPTARIVAVRPKTRVSISLLATKLRSAGWEF